MKHTSHRMYIGQTVRVSSTLGFGQSFGRVRIMPSEAAIRRGLSRWEAQQRNAVAVSNQAPVARILSFTSLVRRRLERRVAA